MNSKKRTEEYVLKITATEFAHKIIDEAVNAFAMALGNMRGVNKDVVFGRGIIKPDCQPTGKEYKNTICCMTCYQTGIQDGWESEGYAKARQEDEKPQQTSRECNCGKAETSEGQATHRVSPYPCASLFTDDKQDSSWWEKKFRFRFEYLEDGKRLNPYLDLQVEFIRELLEDNKKTKNEL